MSTTCLYSDVVLPHLPADLLKIDRSFIRGIPSDEDNKAIAAAIVAMGHRKKGIETQEQLQFVREQHCDQAQGLLFSPPLPADECERLLINNGTAPRFHVFEA